MSDIRYDRQLRLWGEEGQLSIEQTSVCVLGASALGTEIMKCLVLAGVHAVCVIDDAVITSPDLGHNFFLREPDLGRLRAEVVIEYLKELNSAVCAEFLSLCPSSISEDDLGLLLRFSVVVGTNLPEVVSSYISSFLFPRGVPFISARAYGMLGYIRIYVKEHTIANNHEENPKADLRVDCPFPSLLEMVYETDLPSLSSKELRYIPYILLYLLALAKYRKISGDPSNFPDNYDKRKEFLTILWSMRRISESDILNYDNFDEAKTALARSLQKTDIPLAVLDILSDSKCSRNSECVQPFWLICTGLHRFVEKYGVLPLSGSLPDMTSDSKRYAQLVTIYHEKALSDAAEVMELTKQVENERGVGDLISKEMCYRFCKCASQIRVQRGSVIDSDEPFKELLGNIPASSLNENVASPAVWFVLLRAADKFRREKGRYPGTNGVPCSIDAFDLRQRVISLLSANQISDIEMLMTKISDDAIKEMCRYGAGEPHVVASFIAGITAQEVIKLATNQYVPLDNTFIFDGHTQTSAVYKL